MIVQVSSFWQALSGGLEQWDMSYLNHFSASWTARQTVYGILDRSIFEGLAEVHKLFSIREVCTDTLNCLPAKTMLEHLILVA